MKLSRVFKLFGVRIFLSPASLGESRNASLVSEGALEKSAPLIDMVKSTNLELAESVLR